MKAASRLLQRVVPGRSGGDDIREIGSPGWARVRRESMQRDYEMMKEIADKRPLVWDDENACLVHSAANALYNCIQDVRQRSPDVVRARALGGYREFCVKIADGHSVIPRAGERAASRSPARDGEGARGSRRCSQSPQGARRSGSRSARAPDKNSPLASPRTVGPPQQHDPAAVVDDSLYIRPAIRRRPIAPFKAQKDGIRGAIAAYVKSSFAPHEKWESLADMQARDESDQANLMDTMSVISGADTVQAKSHDVSEHWVSDQTRHGLPTCDWSLHGLDSQRAAHPKTVEELQSELMALVDDALIHGTIILTDSNCDLAHVWSCQSQSHGDASKTKKGLRERLRQKLNFGRKSTGACKVAERR